MTTTKNSFDTALERNGKDANVELFDVCSGVDSAAGEVSQIADVSPPAPSKHHGRRQYGLQNHVRETNEQIQSMFDTLMNFPFVGAKR